MELLKTISPVDGALYVERELATSSHINAVIQAASTAQKDWQNTAIEQRMGYCTRAVDYLVAHKAEIAEELTWQMGRPVRFAPGEIDGLEERARYMIAIAEPSLAPTRITEKPGFTRYINHQPLGTVFVIAPWNYPFLTSVNAIIPALLAGNTVILKHSAQTPLVAERYSEAFTHAGLADGVFTHLHLTHQDTTRIIQSDAIDFVAFTGSVPGGEMVEKAAAGRFIGVGLELGGKDPAFVRADADLQHAVETIVDGAFFNTGQSCCGIERAYIHHSIYDDFIEAAAQLVRQYQLGRPDQQATTLGPLVRTSAADFVRGQVTEAIAAHARALINPEDFAMDQAGTPYLAPQLLADVNHNMRVMTEETFGPVLGVMKVTNDDEAIQLMNDSEYGLTAAVFTQDQEAAVRIGNRVNTGTWFMNRCDYLDPALAWTGVGNSGRGCTLSELGFLSLTRPKSFHLKTAL
ncbi:MAG TPA: aldehyde dehydrogenase family protein [Gammaproteobacteria bacterium]|nr:aldehyde dehydrogenase family protein [Gammaproteobacteria bacterium]